MKQVICHQARILNEEECLQVSGGGWASDVGKAIGNMLGRNSSGSRASAMNDAINKGGKMSDEANRNRTNNWSGGCNSRAGGNNNGGSSGGSSSGGGNNGRGGGSSKN
jgi:hypothetical protein